MQNHHEDPSPPALFNFDNTFAKELAGFYVPWRTEPAPKPELVYLNDDLARELSLNPQAVDRPTLASLFSGKQLPPGAQPIAQAYGGHQFGHFNPQLGDGRALIIGEILNRRGERWDIALKGSGRTPFSNGDGKAALGQMIREVVLGEAMTALGVPTTRGLALATTGEWILRTTPLPGAVLTRVAGSHIRVGTFEFYAARGEHDKVRQLADYTIRRHFPTLTGSGTVYLDFLQQVCDRQADLIARWMSLGFIHGVMNTDNMSIAGETIDYGPCAFMESYQPGAVFSYIDYRGRYAYRNQPAIAHWNLARLAEALLSLFDPDTQRALDRVKPVLDRFPRDYENRWRQLMARKLGIDGREPGDEQLLKDWLSLMERHAIDFTLGWRQLTQAAGGNTDHLRQQFGGADDANAWIERWAARCRQEQTTGEDRAKAMARVNPWIIPRNHQVEEAIRVATEDNTMDYCHTLLSALANPWEENEEFAAFAKPAPPGFTENYQTFCGT